MLKEQRTNTLPVTLYYSEENDDFALVLNYNTSVLKSNSYKFVGIQGYAYPTQVKRFSSKKNFIEPNLANFISSEEK